MTEAIRVTCLMDRSWDAATREYVGAAKSGTLIDISMQSADEDPGKLIPAGIVLFDDNTFASVPMQFITKQIN